MSTRSLGASEYRDGEVHDLNAPNRAVLRTALMQEDWLNMSDATRRYWLQLMTSESVRFVGTVISLVRSQIEITIVFSEAHPLYPGMVSFCVTLSNFWRFRHMTA